MKALYICDVEVIAKKKRIKMVIHRNLFPLILDESFDMPKDTLKSQLIGIVKNTIEYSKFNQYTYEYKIINYKFSSKLYETKLSKKDTNVMS